MSKRRINPKYFPSRPPIIATIVGWLALDRGHAPGWVWGAAGCAAVLAWIGAVVGATTEDWVSPAEIDGRRAG